MRLTFFNDWTFGAIKGDRIVDLTEPDRADFSLHGDKAAGPA
jgi:hypothetical protein